MAIVQPTDTGFVWTQGRSRFDARARRVAWLVAHPDTWFQITDHLGRFTTNDQKKGLYRAMQSAGLYSPRATDSRQHDLRALVDEARRQIAHENLTGAHGEVIKSNATE